MITIMMINMKEPAIRAIHQSTQKMKASTNNSLMLNYLTSPTSAANNKQINSHIFVHDVILTAISNTCYTRQERWMLLGFVEILGQ